MHGPTPLSDPADRAAFFGGDSAPPESREEAAQRFEEVFVRQFVKEFTDEMFSSSLTDSAGAASKGQKRMQRDRMTELLTHHLTQEDALDFDEQLMKHWRAKYGPDGASPSS